MQVEIGPAVQPGDAALDHVEADVRRLGDREYLGGRRSVGKNATCGKRGDVMTAKPPALQLRTGVAPSADKRESWRRYADVEPPEVRRSGNRLLALLFDQLGLFIEVGRRRQARE